MQLQDYPQAIADLQREMFKAEQHLRLLKESQTIILASIDRQVAFDQSLKNDTQRKARRVELMDTDGDYIEVGNDLRKAEAIYTELDIELQLLRNTFSVLKLERREAIATMELHASNAA